MVFNRDLNFVIIEYDSLDIKDNEDERRVLLEIVRDETRHAGNRKCLKFKLKTYFEIIFF